MGFVGDEFEDVGCSLADFKVASAISDKQLRKLYSSDDLNSIQFNWFYSIRVEVSRM